MPASWFSQVENVFASQPTPVPDPVWEAIMDWESGGNPKAINLSDPGGSFGLFQLNRGRGQGKGQTIAVLWNPIDNAKLAAPSISRAYAEAKALGYTGNMLAEYTATHSGHPGYAPKGKLLPDPGTPGYKDFVKEAAGVGGAYSSITKGLVQSFQIQPSNIQPVAEPLPTPGGSGSGVWGSMLSELHDTSTIAGWNHPVDAIKGLLIMVVFLILGAGLVFVGGKSVLNL